MSVQHIRVQGEPSRSPPANRRATVRYHCAPATPGRIAIPPKLEMQRAWILDVSRGGVGLLLDRPVKPDQRVTLRLSGAASGQVYELTARVAHTTQEPCGDWVIGCELDRELSRDELDDLLS
jgi:hypothetical protein